MIRSTRTLLNFFGYTLAVIATALILTECGLQVYARFFEDTYKAYEEAYQRADLAHIHDIWIGTPDPENPFFPPLQVVSNRGSDDPARMDTIFKESRFPPARTWNAYNFVNVHTDASTTAYTITTNKLGFRGKEYDAHKPPHTFRIIVLGSYQSFGLGVGDDETYESQLEAKLNARRDGRRYEVWNMGRPAGTAIVGLAQMKHDIFEYEPDLIILDYGQVDSRITGDGLFPSVMLFPGAVGSLIKSCAWPITAILDRSILWGMWMNYRYNVNPQLDNVFIQELQEMTTLGWEHNVPTILVQQLPAMSIPSSRYEQLTNDHVFFFSVRDWFLSHPPQYPDKTEWKTGYWKKTYLAELDPERVSPKSKSFGSYPYRLDLFQLNSMGMRQVAAGLEELIVRNVIHEK